MEEFNVKNNGTYVKFVNLFKLTELEQALLPYKNTEQYESVIRYYFACIGMQDSLRLLEPLGLLKQALLQFQGNRRVTRSPKSRMAGSVVGVSRISGELEHFSSRFEFSVERMKEVATQVPKTLHFVWLGGGLGDIQRDYLNVWKQALAEQGYTLNLWYDSDALLAWETNRLIVEAAKADVFLQGLDDSISTNELATLYEDRALVLKQQMYAHINEEVANGGSADLARIDLLSRAYGQDEVKLLDQMEQNRRSVLDMSGFELRDLHAALVPMQLQDIYEREMRLRGNMAAASDIVRLDVLYAEGGSYTDIDHLPPMPKTLGGVDISAMDVGVRLGVLQLLLNENPEWMPKRHYSDSHIGEIPPEHLPALKAFALSHPVLNQVFLPPEDRMVRPFFLRGVANKGHLSNAFLMAHPRSAVLKAVIEHFRFSYTVIDATARLAAQRGIALSSFDAMQPIATQVLEGIHGPLIDLPPEMEQRARRVALVAASYVSDGIRPQSDMTIYLTGPAAVRDGMDDYAMRNLNPSIAETLRKEGVIADYSTVNGATEEELDHSWMENEPTETWGESERTHWKDGRYKTRYKGDIAQLLKHSTIEFEQGWPVIEGRAVLLTDVLERLVEALGERFIEAMSQGHDGEIRFEKPLPLSFNDRQAIRNQAPEALAPAFLSNAQIGGLGVDEVLSDIASGSRSFIEVSPLQRLSLGVLLGLDLLDNQRFTQSASELENLANSVADQGVAGRYAVIERQLSKQPGFIAGLRGDLDPLPMPSDSALELKKNALKQARTLLQWGRHVERIQQVATREYRSQVEVRMMQVILDSEADRFHSVPQHLLLDSSGEAVGGRCYPLALVMGAALAQGEMSSRHLRGRFSLAVDESGKADSKAFVQALEALRDVQMSEVGTSLGRANLDQVTARLREQAAPRTLMLNSDNHSMLVAKTINGARATYHFFDPNFGLFEFEHPDAFKQALKHFFQKQGMAGYYAAYGLPALPEFDLIELQGKKISALKLSDELTVEDLLKPDPLPGEPAQGIRERLNRAHGKSLRDNSHLGSSLLELDSHWWGQQIAHATVALQELHPLATPLVPLFETLEITPEGKYRVSLINPSDPQHLVQVLSDDHRLLRIKNWLTEQFSALAGKPVETGGVPDPTEAGSVHTLNAGFTIQALMNALRGREGDGRTLTMAVRLHAYVNYAQLVHGNVVDVAGLVQLVRTALAEEKTIARTCAPIVGEALGHAANEGVGAVLGLANVGFDIYQLTTAQTEVEKAQFGTQLTFDSASLVLMAGGLGAGAAGATTAAAVLGGAGVILGGLAVGVAALAQGFATVAREAQEVGKFFADMEQAYRGAGYHFDDALSAWVVRPSLIVKSIDLREGKVMLDSPKLYPLRDHFGVPEYERDYARAINLRQQFALSGQMGFTAPAGQLIVLPCTPQTCYGYEYKALPFANWRHDRGFDTARRLEKKTPDGQWQFLFSFYSFPSDYILNRLTPEYRETVIKVYLDAVERALVIPVLPKVWHGKLSYWLRGADHARCTVTLNPGANLSLVAPSQTFCRWVLQASWASESDIRVEPSGELYIGTVQVMRSGGGRQEVLIRTRDQLFSVTQDKRELDLIEQTAAEGLDEQKLLERYKTLAQEHRLALPYTPVHHYLIPFEDPQAPRYTTAWYDSREDRFLYVRDEEVSGINPQLSAVIGDAAYFYDPKGFQIWQTDCVTGLLTHRYRLLHEGGKSTINSVEADAQGVIHVVQECTVGNQPPRQYRYLIHDGQLLLSSVTHDRAPHLQALLSGGDTLAEWSTVLGNFQRLKAPSLSNGASTVEWQPAPYVSICWKIDSQYRDMVWVRSRDRLLIPAQPGRNHARGWDDSIKNLNGLMLFTLSDDSDVFFIYQRVALNQTLCRLQRNVINGEGRWTHKWVQPNGLKDVFAVEGGYVLVDENGLFFNLTEQGEAQLGGLSAQWLKDRAHWWQALEPIAKRYPGRDFAIVGLRNFQGNGNLCAWYVDNRLLLCDPGPGKDVRLLGVTPDNQAVWLFDLSNGEIWSQAFIDPQQLDQAFGTGSQLLLSASLPPYQREWEDWRFADVTVEGAGLRGTTIDGVSLALRHQEMDVITGVKHDWVTAHSDRLIEDLQLLLEEAEYCEFVSVESEPGSLQWYDVKCARLIRIADTNLPRDYALLGTQDQVNVLLHEREDGRVHIYPDTSSIGPFDYVQRNAGVLVVEGQKVRSHLAALIPDDVNTLLVRLGQGAVTCHLTKAVWLKLDSVVVDCRHGLDEVPAIPGKLIWAFDEPEKLLFEIVQEHLIIVDPDSEHCLIFRDVCSVDPVLRGEVFLGFDGVKVLPSVPVSALVALLRDRKNQVGGTTLLALQGELPIAG